MLFKKKRPTDMIIHWVSLCEFCIVKKSIFMSTAISYIFDLKEINSEIPYILFKKLPRILKCHGFRDVQINYFNSYDPCGVIIHVMFNVHLIRQNLDSQWTAGINPATYRHKVKREYH